MARKVIFVSLSYQFFKVCTDFGASAATSDPVLNDGSSNVALMAVKTKEELEEQAIAIEPSAERGQCLNKLVMGGASGTFLAERGRCVIISAKTAVSFPIPLLY